VAALHHSRPCTSAWNLAEKLKEIRPVEQDEEEEDKDLQQAAWTPAASPCKFVLYQCLTASSWWYHHREVGQKEGTIPLKRFSTNLPKEFSTIWSPTNHLEC